MQKKPRVLHIVTAPQSAKGLMRGQLSYLRQAGFDVGVVTSPGPQLQVVKEREGVDVYAVPMEREISPFKDLLALWRLWRLIRRLKPALVNFSTPKAGLLGGVASLLAGVPCRIYTLRGLRLETVRGLKWQVLRICEKTASFSAHRIICISESLRQRGIENGLFPKKKACVLGKGSSNGVDLSRFTLDAEKIKLVKELCEGFSITEDVPVIGFVGRLTKDKGIVELIDAFGMVQSAIPDARLLLIGRFEEGDPVPCGTRERIENDPSIIRTGYIDDPVPYYYMMTVFAFPSYREGFPNVVLEAGAAGVPVVGARATGVVDAVVDGETGLLGPVGDAQVLADNLLRVLQDKNLAKRLGDAGRRRVEQHFSSEYVWKELEKFYRQELAKRGLM